LRALFMDLGLGQRDTAKSQLSIVWRLRNHRFVLFPGSALSYKNDVVYNDGPCPKEGAVAACQVAAGVVYFYSGQELKLEIGCDDYLLGVPRPDLAKTSDTTEATE
jgi:hypothetical protein